MSRSVQLSDVEYLQLSMDDASDFQMTNNYDNEVLYEYADTKPDSVTVGTRWPARGVKNRDVEGFLWAKGRGIIKVDDNARGSQATPLSSSLTEGWEKRDSLLEMWGEATQSSIGLINVDMPEAFANMEYCINANPVCSAVPIYEVSLNLRKVSLSRFSFEIKHPSSVLASVFLSDGWSICWRSVGAFE